ncbi:hypothetical protein ACIOHS_00425 [Streptomyces sp. NPDC088253]|uniref:hypothetical protein n=1 Tax=Streptomyces sp. NPDC088253 TaxID=3365846 RepID=UPI0038191B6B
MDQDTEDLDTVSCAPTICACPGDSLVCFSMSARAAQPGQAGVRPAVLEGEQL